MDKSGYFLRATGVTKPSGKPSTGMIVLEKRKRRKDRRRLHTYIADDLRNGIADRRKGPIHGRSHESLEVEDRRRTYTYLADDQRSGIVDRRRSKRYLPPLRQVVIYCSH